MDKAKKASVNLHVKDAIENTKMITMTKHLKDMSQSEAFSAAKASGSCEDLLAIIDQLYVTMRDVPNKIPMRLCWL